MALTYVKASGIDITGNYTVNNITATSNVSATYFVGNGSSLTGVTSTTAVTVTANAQPNITSVGSLSSLTVTGLVTATSGGIKVGNLQDTSGTNTVQLTNSNMLVTGNITAGVGGTGNVTATYFIGNGSQLTGLPATYSNTNVAAYLPTYTGNFTAGNANISGTLTVGTFTTAGTSGNIAGANYVIANFFSGDGSLLDNIVAGNIDGQVSNSLVAGTVYTNAQPNITSVGTLTDLSVSGNAVVAGNLTVGGTTSYVNVTTLAVKDPIIEIGDGANGVPLTTNDGKDRGSLLHYYTTAPVDAFMGWDNSNGEFAFGSNVSISSEVVTFNTLGNVRAQTFIGSLAGAANTAATVTTNAQPNITSVGSLVNLTVTGLITATAGGIKVGNLQDTSGTNTVQLTNSNMIVTGNITAGAGGTGNVTASYFVGNGSLLTGISSSSLNVIDDTTTNSTYYPVFSTSSSGTLSNATISTTKLQFNPSSGQLTVQDLNTLSDATLKMNPQVIEDPMTILNQIFGMGFNWADTGKKSYGMMAQMLEKVLPELVTNGPDGKKSVNYIPIIAFLVEAVKKQQSDIDDLKKR